MNFTTTIIMDRYPYSIVWTPLPIISWFLPLIGHTGIANSDGVIHDFGGSFYIAVDHMTFGRPTKFLKLDPSKAQALEWDEAIQVSDNRFCERHHNIITNNCHNHVADALNEMNYNGIQGFLKQWGFLILFLLILTIIVFLTRS